MEKVYCKDCFFAAGKHLSCHRNPPTITKESSSSSDHDLERDRIESYTDVNFPTMSVFIEEERWCGEGKRRD